MYRSSWVAALLVSASSLLLPAQALSGAHDHHQGHHHGHAHAMYGLGKAFGIQDIPPGILKRQMDALPPPAQERALKWFQGFSFTDQDFPALRVDSAGGVFYEDPIRENSEGSSESGSPALSELTQSQTFTLHSKPGASRTVYLDMDGHVVSGTAWNSSADPLYMRPYDSDGNEASFSQAELNEIAEVWKRVAEDFAPYDIDVTTEEPPSFGPQVGHILVTRKADENNNQIYNCSCGGVAYVNVWGVSNYTYYQPALVFLDGVGGPHNIAEAASHELGHNLALSHDGNSSTGYYTGHGSGNTDWGPIMGVGYYAQVTQWSKGEYADANNTQDDLQIIADRLGYRSDDHEDVTWANASPLIVTSGTQVDVTTPVSDPANSSPFNKGVIEHRSDVDLFWVDVGDGPLSLNVSPAWLENYASSSRRGMNLDVRAVLYDELGNQIVQSNPGSDTYAQIDLTVAAGRYYLAVEGVGAGDPLTTGYTDYGSIGQYFISGSISESLGSTVAPTAPTDLSAVLVGENSISLSWTDPISTAESDESGYRVYRQENGGANVLLTTLPRGSDSHADNNLPSGDYAYQVEPFNSVGSNYSNVTPALTINVPVYTYASSESMAYGQIVSGSYLSTQDLQGYERLSEQHQGGRPNRRVSQLNHSWTLSNVAAGAVVSLEVLAAAAANSEGDDFRFAYSLNGTDYTTIGDLDNGTGQQTLSATLPAGVSGTVYLRVQDTDQTVGYGQNDTLDVYRIRVVSAGDPGEMPPTVTISSPGDGSQFTEGDMISFSGAANDPEDGNITASITWESDLDGVIGLGGSVQAQLSVGAHQVTASATDSASNTSTDGVTVTVNVPTQNSAPVAVNDAYTINQDTLSTFDVLFNDSDADSDPLTIVSVTQATNGSVSNNGSDLSYKPNAGFTGQDTFTYTLSDGMGGSDTATVTVTVNGGGPLSVSGLSPDTITLGQSEVVTISGSGFEAGATISFANGSGPSPTVSSVSVQSSGEINATISTKNSGPSRARVWDVIVTNPGGASASCGGCLTITP